MNYVFFYSHTKNNAFMVDFNLGLHESMDFRVLSNLFPYDLNQPTSEAVYQSQKVEAQHRNAFLNMLCECDKRDPKLTAHLGQARGITLKEYSELFDINAIPAFLEVFDNAGGEKRIRARATKDFDGWNAMRYALKLKYNNGAFAHIHPMQNTIFVEWTDNDQIWATNAKGEGKNWLGIQLTALLRGEEPKKTDCAFVIPEEVLKVLN